MSSHFTPLRPHSFLLVASLLGACSPTPSADPPDPSTAPTLAIVDPPNGATLQTGPDSDRPVMLSFETSGVQLRAPGTCLASDGPCGHVQILVDGPACNADGSPFNSIAVSSPARASLARCPEAAGTHTVTLSLAHDDRSPWLDDEAPIAVSVAVTAELPPLLARLGGRPALQALAASMIERQLGTSSINAYFRNASVDQARMELCMGALFEQLASPGSTAATDLGCETDMQAAHAGLGTSRADMDDWLAQFDAAAASVGIAPGDFDELLALIGAASGGIVEDPENDATLYQRLGRRPGIWAAVQTFSTKLAMNAQVSRYFLNDDGIPEYSEVFAVCLARLLGSLDGPFVYGEEFPLEPALFEAGRNCRGMVESHEDSVSAPPQSSPIGPDEFLEVALALVSALEYHEVPPADIDLLVGAMNLPALCSQILAGPSECELLFPSAGR